MSKSAQWHTGNGVLFLIDEREVWWVKKHRWHLSKRGYITTKIKRKNVCLHRMLIKAEPGFDVDHINGNKLDNRMENLRVCTHQQNCFNQKLRKTNTSGFIGVSKKSDAGKYEAYIHLNGRKHYLGLFDSASDAAMTRDRAAIEMFGQHARLNFEHERVG